MQNMKLYTILETVLKSNTNNLALIDNQGDLMLNKIHDLVDKTDENLIGLLLENQEIREKFFIRIKDVFVFKTSDFKFFLDENKIDNSYTQYENRIGLTAGGKFLKDSSDVVLDFPYKDCILEGGQSTEEGTDTYFEYDANDNHYQEKQAKRKEIFFNSILAKDEIDRLLEPKAFTNFKHYTASTDKSRLVPTFERDENGTIKDNLIIKGNNLLALHSLKSEFAGKVKLIYIDPPFNTGNDTFKYNDNFSHSSWLTFMRNRLTIAKELLREDGVIYIQIDNNELGHLKLLCDEIFSNGFLQIISIKKATTAGFKAINFCPITVTEFILVYTKNKTNLKNKFVYKQSNFNEDYGKVIINKADNPENWIIESLDNVVLNESKYLDWKECEKEFGKYWKEIRKEMKSIYAFKNKESVISTKDLHKPSKAIKEMMEKSKEQKDKIFEIKRDNVDSIYIVNGRSIAFYSNKFRIIDGESVPSEPLTNFWDDISWYGIGNEGSIELKNAKKPEKLLKRILELSTEECDIVLDYHLGSGTTAAAAHKMNRQYIGIEQLDYGNNDSVVRLENVLNGESSGISKSVNWQGGGSFIYLELAKNNQNAIENIQSCESYEALVAFFDEMCSKYFLHYNVKVKEFREVICKEDNFKKLTLEQQKIMFAKMLDLNQLYVNVSDMKDSRFGLSENDIAITKDFYKL